MRYTNFSAHTMDSCLSRLYLMNQVQKRSEPAHSYTSGAPTLLHQAFRRSAPSQSSFEASNPSLRQTRSSLLVAAIDRPGFLPQAQSNGISRRCADTNMCGPTEQGQSRSSPGRRDSWAWPLILPFICSFLYLSAPARPPVHQPV